MVWVVGGVFFVLIVLEYVRSRASMEEKNRFCSHCGALLAFCSGWLLDVVADLPCFVLQHEVYQYRFQIALMFCSAHGSGSTPYHECVSLSCSRDG